jgi:hypothetical protein
MIIKINELIFGIKTSNEINGIEPRSLMVNHQVNQRSYANFNLITPISLTIKKSSIIEMIHDEVTIFKGTIDSVIDRKEVGQKWHQISCVDNHYFVDKRVYAKGFLQEKTGNIVKQLVDDILHEEGIWYDENSIQSGTPTSILFNYDYCNNVMEKLVERSGYVWWIDNDKKICFQDPTTVRNPNTITESIIKRNSLRIENDRSKFRNLQYIKGAMELSEEKTTIVKFDGTNTNFTMTLPLGELISIRVKYLEDGLWHVMPPEDIGKKNEDEIKPFMWAQGDNSISVDRMWIKENEEIEFKYRGQIPIIGLSTNQRQIEELKALEGGSGKVEHIETEPELIGALAAIQSANAKNQKYGRLDQMSLFFTTLKPGYDAGELVPVDLPEEGIHEDFLIESVEIYEDNNLIWYDVKCVRGNIFESWARVFQKALEKNDTANQNELKLEETIVIAKDYSKIWNQSDNPNPFNYWFPSEIIYPSEDLYPSFNIDTRMTKIEVTCDGNVHQVMKSSFIDYDSNLLTLFYINSSEINGLWSNIKFYGGQSGEILFDEVSVNFIKNELEAVQIQRSEIKGW